MVITCVLRLITMATKKTAIRIDTRIFNASLVIAEEQKVDSGHFHTFEMIASASTLTLPVAAVEHGTGKRRIVIWEMIGWFTNPPGKKPGISSISNRYLRYLHLLFHDWIDVDKLRN